MSMILLSGVRSLPEMLLLRDFLLACLLPNHLIVLEICGLQSSKKHGEKSKEISLWQDKVVMWLLDSDLLLAVQVSGTL